MFDIDRTIRGMEREGFKFGLAGSQLIIQPPCGSAFSDAELRQYQEEIVDYIRERERKNKLQKQGVPQIFSLQEASEIAPDKAAYFQIMQETGGWINSIPDIGPAMGLIASDFPELQKDVNDWGNRLGAAVGKVSVEEFQQLANQCFDRHVELVAIARAAHEGNQ